MSLHLLLVVHLSAAAPQSLEPPPGMVFVRGGTTKIGSMVKEIEITETEFLAEMPQHSRRVDDFFLMTTEVTNEQYAAFVQATGAYPPLLWGETATNEARRTFLEEQAQRITVARGAGKPLPEREKFDAAEWWRKNYEGREWRVPVGKEALPVTFVNYANARAYARWAGLRLMTEFEYQRACRGNSAQQYPWGDDAPDTDRCAFLDSRINEPLPVGALKGGASMDGVLHLAGNVWEWTSSPFTAYPKFEDLAIPGVVTWDVNQRVSVGGSFADGAMACRCTTRRATDRDDSSELLGFRCAGSVPPGLDAARHVMKDDLPLDTRPEGVEFDEGKVLAMELWTSNPGSVTDVPGYAVITGHDYVLFVPCGEIDAVSVRGLKELSIEQGVVTMGVLSTTVPVVEPELPRGTYYVSFRAASDPPRVSGGVVRNPIRVPGGYQWERDNFIFYSADGQPVASRPAEWADMTYVRPKKPEVVVGKGVRIKDGGNATYVEEPVDVASFKVNSWVRVANKGFHYSLRLMFAPGTVTDGWRY